MKTWTRNLGARRLCAHGYRPLHLFASGLWSPVDQAQEKYAPHLWESAFLELDIPAALRADANYMQHFASLIRSDTALLQSYAGCSPQEAIDVPITVFSGGDDTVAPPTKVARWSHCTSAAFHHVSLPGKHMFIEASAGSVHEAICSSLSAAIAIPKNL